MKIFALIGSPRKGSNTDTLVEEVFRGAERGGHTWRQWDSGIVDHTGDPAQDEATRGDTVFVWRRPP